MANGFTLFFTGGQEVPPGGSAASSAAVMSSSSGGGVRVASYSHAAAGGGADAGSVLRLGAHTETTADDVTIVRVHDASGGVGGAIVFGHASGPVQDAGGLAPALNSGGCWTVGSVWDAATPADASIAGLAAMLDRAFAGMEATPRSNVHAATFPGGGLHADWTGEPGAVDWGAVLERLLARSEAADAWFCL